MHPVVVVDLNIIGESNISFGSLHALRVLLQFRNTFKNLLVINL